MTIQELLNENNKIGKAINKDKAALKSMKKAKRKLRKALKAKQVTEIRILIGMASAALDTARTKVNML